MSPNTKSAWITLSPPFPEDSAERGAFHRHALRLAQLLDTGGGDEPLDEAIQEALRPHTSEATTATSRAAHGVLTDLARQRWPVRVTEGGDVQVRRPVGHELSPRREKARIRAQELVKRDEQLREPSKRRFIKGMEKRALHKGKFVSVFSLLRDGRELASSLRSARSLPEPERLAALKRAVDPYLQFVDEAECCEHTGLRLQDIWRYFRHTWTNQYTSTPGRSMAFLVRDRARDNHPIVGIGSIGSPIMQIRERDAWIGWHSDAFMEFASESPSAELGRWLCDTVDTAIQELYVVDFFEEGLLSPSDLRSPTPQALERLSAHGETQRALHHRLAQARELKRPPKRDALGSTVAHWEQRARAHLYRSKRALSLAEMLGARLVLQRHLSESPSSEELRALLETREGRKVVKKILRKAKADRVGIAMADITVCGAVAPYNPILGGKLVSMLAASPAVVRAYREKYSEQESEIASSMAGRPIVRPSELVFLGTTSLYGVGSSQYNRLRMPSERIGGRRGERLAFLELGKSEAYGTSHFSSDTVAALVSLVQQSSNGLRVNSIFGEGVSPKLRKLRDGLNALNFPASKLLKHGRQRIVYGVPLVRNLREYLLGMDAEPEYMFRLERAEESVEEIAAWWTERWLQMRINSDDVLERVERHTLVRPIRHGARVVLPRVEDDQVSLFDDLAY